MALVLADRVLETTTTAGSGTITLAGAKTGYQSFSAIGNGNTTYYTIALQGGAEWEVGIGTYTSSGTTLSRDTVLASSAGGAKVTFSAGTKDVFVDYPAEKALYPNESGNISALSGKIINLAAPENNSDAATKQYVDDLASTGLFYHQAVNLTSTSAFSSYNITYNNGTSGVSATITQAVPYSSLTIDSTGASVNQRILIKDAANAAYNGVYVVNSTGSGATPFVMMRSTDADTYGPGTGDLSLNDYFFTQSGVANKGSAYVCTVPSAIIFGTTPITFSEFSNSQVYSAGTGIDITGVTISLQTPVTVANGGSGAATLTGYVKGNGTSAFTASATVPVGDLSGTVGISQGGTGQTTQQAAINALAGAVTDGYFLRGNGTNVGMSGIQVTDVPTLNQNTTGQAGSVANALTINNSGAGSASGSTYNGSAARTISYNSVGAAPSDGSTTITKLGTVTTGTWNADTIGVGYGGTGKTSWTLNGLVYASGTGTLANSSQLVFDGTNLGIGKTPSTALDVSGTITGTTVTGTNMGTQGSTQLQAASANITTVTGTTISATNMGAQATTQFQGASANITTVTGTTISATNMGAQATTQFQAASANITTITGTTGTFTTNSDGSGNVRNIPSVGAAKVAPYTLTTADIGKYVTVGSAGSVTVPNSTFAAGNVISVYNDTTGNVSINISTTTGYISGTNTNRTGVTLATRGVATILFTSGTYCVISGNVT